MFDPWIISKWDIHCCCAPSPVPKEHLKIARSFNCGCGNKKEKVPQGRLKLSTVLTSSRPKARSTEFYGQTIVLVVT
jgi:hypothetical protein